VERACKPIASRATPPKTILIPTRSPSCRTTWKIKNEDLARKMSITPLPTIRAHRPENSRRGTWATLLEVEAAEAQGDVREAHPISRGRAVQSSETFNLAMVHRMMILIAIAFGRTLKRASCRGCQARLAHGTGRFRSLPSRSVSPATRGSASRAYRCSRCQVDPAHQ
jgi:hypothetical protein